MKPLLTLLLTTAIIGLVQFSFNISSNALHVDSRTGVDNSSCLDVGQTPCLTLMYALLGVANSSCNSTTISISSGTYNLTEVVQLSNMENFTLCGRGKETSIIKCSESGGGIYLTNIVTTSISDITFSGCSHALAENAFTLSFTMCTDVSLMNIGIVNSASGAVSVTSCGGLIEIENCEFINNGINTTTYTKGGALSVVLPSTNKSAVSIANCLFRGNVANMGGAIHVEVYQLSWVWISNSIFTQNFALLWETEMQQSLPSGNGGAVSLYLGLHSEINYTVTIVNTSFSSNTAVTGAGVNCLMEKRRNVIPVQQSFMLSLTQCRFEDNTATTGAAFVSSISELDSFGLSPWILFAGNHFIYNVVRAEGIHLGTGTVLISNTNVELNGKNRFLGNYGSAFVLSNGVLTLRNNSNIEFIRNRGFNGGGLQLIGKSFLLVNYNSSMAFLFNQAENKGGAIYHIAQGIFWNIPSSCFVQFIGEENSTYFIFEGNQARDENNAIYSNSISACSSNDNNNNVSGLSLVFCRSNWLYPSSGCRELVDSEAAEFLLLNITDGFQVFSGVSSVLPLTVISLVGDNITEDTTLTATVNETGAFIQPSSGLISNNKIEIYGKDNSTGYLKLQTSYPPFVGTTIPYRIQPCPPGFLPRLLDLNGQADTCACAENAFVDGTLQCNSDMLTSDLVVTHCISQSRRNSSVLVAGVCPFLFESTQRSTIRLPRDPSEVEESICGQINRQGVLCGECKPGYAVSVYSYSLACIECKGQSYSWLIYLLAQYLPIVLIFILVTLLNLSIISPASNAFLFFSQVTSASNAYIYQIFITKYAFGDTAGSVIAKSYNTIYGVSNLDFFRAFLPPICFHENFDILFVVLLDYLAAFFPFILVILSYILIVLYNRNFRLLVWLWKPFMYCLAKLHARFETRISLVDGFATFLVLSYLKILTITFRFLQFVFVYDIHGTILETVYYYNGNLKMFQGFHLPFGILALITIFTVIAFPPILLTCYQFKWFQNLLEKLHIRNQALVTFVEVVQSGLTDGRDGTKDRRFFAGFYFILRIALFGPTTVAPQVFAMIIVPVLTYTVGVMSIVIFQPYQNTFYNKLDVLFLMILIIVSFVFTLALIFALSGVPGNVISPLLYFSYFLSYLPLAFMVSHVVRWVVTNTKAFKGRCHKEKGINDERVTDTQAKQRSPSLFSAPDRVLQPDVYQSLLVERENRYSEKKRNSSKSHDNYDAYKSINHTPKANSPTMEMSTYTI